MTSTWSLLALDLDGTLLGPEGGVSTANAGVMHQMRSQGLQHIVATGRCRNETIHALKPLGYQGGVIGASGAILSDFESGKTIHRSTIPPSDVERIVGHVSACGHLAHVLKDHHETGYDYLLVGDSHLHPVSKWWMESMDISVRYARSIEDDPDPDHTIRVGGIGEQKDIGPVTARIESDSDLDISLQQWGAVTSSHAIGSPIHIVETFGPGVGKWRMILHHCMLNGLDPSRVAAIGDGLNDVDMLTNAAHGIAMANAEEEVRASADHVAGHHAEDGFAHAVRALMKLETSLSS